MKTVLCIGGSDSSGGAGIQGDLKTIHAHGLYGVSVVTTVTSQDHRGVHGQHLIPIDVIQSQLTSVAETFQFDAIKVGVVPTPAHAQTLRQWIRTNEITTPIIVDPVLRASSGDWFIKRSEIDTIWNETFAMATLVTPNIPEAELLLTSELNSLDTILEAGQKLLEYGSRAVLLKGGHSKLYPGVDFLFTPDKPTSPLKYSREYFSDRNVHGTGCTYATAIACNLAMFGDLTESVRRAKHFIGRAIEGANQVTEDYWVLNHNVDTNL